MSEGIKVAKPGKRQPDSSDPRSSPTDTAQKELIFNTDLLTFKYVKQGVLRVDSFVSLPDPSIGDYTIVNIFHGMGYPPSFRVYVRDPRTGIIKEPHWDAGSTGASFAPYVDDQNLSLLINGGEFDNTFGDNNQPFDVIYFIGADNLETVED